MRSFALWTDGLGAFTPCQARRLYTMHQSKAALYVLLVGVVRYYGYLAFDPAIRGSVSKGLGGLAMVAVAPLLYQARPSRPMYLVLLWWCFEGLQTAICSFAYAVQPWSVPVGESICSAGIGFDLGALGIMLAALLLVRIDDGIKKENKP